MALGTAVLLLGAHARPASQIQASPMQERGRILAALAWFGRLSYELYLFHLVVLGGMRTVWPARAVANDGKLLLLVGYVTLSAVLASFIARFYSEPLNRGLRQFLMIGGRSALE